MAFTTKFTVLPTDAFQAAGPVSTEPLLSLVVLLSVAPLSSNRFKKISCGGTKVLPLSTSKIGGKIKPQTQSSQLGPLIPCSFEIIDFWLLNALQYGTESIHLQRKQVQTSCVKPWNKVNTIITRPLAHFCSCVDRWATNSQRPLQI